MVRMANIIALDLFRRDQHHSAGKSSAFLKLVNTNLRAEFTRKKEVLRAIGNPSAVVQEAVQPSNAGNNIMLLFSGVGQLKGYSFTFVVRDDPQNSAISAEILVLDSSANALLTKQVGWCLIRNYSQSWLNDAYNEALELIAPASDASGVASA